jgi:hypothetical protein
LQFSKKKKGVALTRRIGVFGYNFFTQQGEKWLEIYKCNRSRCVHEQIIPSGGDSDVFVGE